MYTVQNETFEGPLDLLLSLIEKEQLDITQISLAKITGAYLEIIKKIDGTSEELSEFLVIAAKLLYIKSKKLIPNLETSEEEAEIEDLEEKLKEYQKYKEAAAHIENVLSKNYRSYHRGMKVETKPSFLPPKELDSAGLFAIFNEVLNRLPEEEKIENVEIVKEKTVSLEEKRDHVLKSIRKSGRTSFKKILGTAKSKTEVIVTFLAILEMIKQKEVKVSQDTNFADFNIILIK